MTWAWPRGLRVSAAWGRRTACRFNPWESRARTYIPGSSRRSGFGKTARSVTVPVASWTETSENASFPSTP